jgi:hypothetical protein
MTELGSPFEEYSGDGTFKKIVINCFIRSTAVAMRIVENMVNK